MYDVAEPVEEWQAAGEPVLLARLVETRGFSSRWPGEVAAYRADGQRRGGLLAGAADRRLAELAAAWFAEPDRPAELHAVPVSDDSATAAGLACGGQARILLQPASTIAGEVWERLRRREPVALVTSLAGSDIGATTEVRATDGVHQAGPDAGPDPTPEEGADPGRRVDAVRVAAAMLARGATDAVVEDAPTGALLLAAYSPTPRLLVVGDGLLADALVAQAQLLGWAPAVASDPGSAVSSALALGAADGVIVLSHAPEVDAPVLAAALQRRPAYVGALGSRRTQSRRAEQLRAQGLGDDDLARIHGPAGLDIGAQAPAEIAVAVVAELLAVRSGTDGGSLRDRPGPVHVRPS